jgi:glyoxylase-like metal-dependent hydrolase (beta-lactamase superfamily II)
MRSLPTARLVVHPLGARHLIDPTHLTSSARRVYGAEELERSYGTIVGVAPERVLRTADDMTLELGGRPLKFLDTPGHARHHHCIWDERSRGFFTGDTFGISYREFDNAANGAWIFPTTTPIQFEPIAMRRSVQRMLAHEPASLYLTHYGRVGDVPRLGALLLAQMDEMVAFASALPNDAARHAALAQGFGAIYLKHLRAQGCTLTDARVLELLALDLELNAQGMAFWLNRDNRLTRRSA